MMPAPYNGTLLQIPTAMLLIQFPVNAPGKETEDGPSTGATATMWESQLQFSAPAAIWGSEPANLYVTMTFE